MSSDGEPAKLLLPYLQRADELQKHEPLVAYYCRLYAMEKGLKIPQKDRTKTTNALLISLMKQLEKDKKSLKLGPDDSLHIEGFASNVFAKADKQDRAGRADINTAKTFYAAGIFFEILNQFGELQPDIEQKQKYAVWKAAEIRKALKEGRRPEPGPPGGDKDLTSPTGLPPSQEDFGQTLSARPPSSDISSPSLDTNLGRISSFNTSHSGAGISSPHEGSRNFSTGYSGADLSSSRDDMINPTASSEVHTSAPSPQSHDYHSAEDPAASSRVHTSGPSYQGHDYHSTENPTASSDVNTSAPSYQSHDYHSADYNHPHPVDRTESSYPQTYNHQPQSIPHNYYSQETNHQPTSYSYANLQSYPSFNETTFPTAPTHQPGYYQGPSSSYSNQSAPSVSNYPSGVQYGSSNRNVNHAEPPHPSPPASNYNYDSNYQPPPEKIAEAHKVARFAVGSLAFDDVPTAVDYLQRALELLTNPTAEAHPSP